MIKVLLLEDDAILSREIVNFLTLKHLSCTAVFDGTSFINQSKNNQHHIYLLDINVPGINGLEVCREIRKSDTETPILMITAYGDISDKKEAYKIGADDYLVKPFHFDELLLRIQALIRRSSGQNNKNDILVIGDLEINTGEKLVKRSGQLIDLTPKEFQLLLLLAKAKGRTLSKQVIADNIWDIHFDSNLNTIEVYINFLRKKIDKNFPKKLIYTRPGFGYYLKAENHDS